MEFPLLRIDVRKSFHEVLDDEKSNLHDMNLRLTFLGTPTQDLKFETSSNKRQNSEFKVTIFGQNCFFLGPFLHFCHIGTKFQNWTLLVSLRFILGIDTQPYPTVLLWCENNEKTLSAKV